MNNLPSLAKDGTTGMANKSGTINMNRQFSNSQLQ